LQWLALETKQDVTIFETLCGIGIASCAASEEGAIAKTPDDASEDYSILENGQQIYFQESRKRARLQNAISDIHVHPYVE
jgi:hypothetical protein